MGLKDVLERNKVPLPPDFEERMDIVVAALRRSPSYPEKIKAFKRKGKQSGGQSKEDWLGPQLQNFITVITSPAAQGVLRSVFAVVFFVSYLEKIPVFGNILSAVLDLMVMGGKMMVKTVQKNLPPLIGLIPLPFMGLFGIAIAALFGFIMWPIIAIVSLSRQDFTAAVESFIRVIPPPIGDTIADLFLEGNRTVARLNEKRIALANDIAKAFEAISEAIGGITEQATALGEKTKEVAKQGVQEVKTILNEPVQASVPVATTATPSLPPTAAPEGTPTPEPTPPTAAAPQTAGRRHRFSRRPRRKQKWRTQRRTN